MKLKQTFTLIALAIGLTYSLQSQADSSTELSCRNKAKETAADVYKNCMTDLRQSQLEQIRKDYKEKLSELKSHYDNELKKISGKNRQDKAARNSDKSSDQLAEEQTKVQPTKMSVKLRSSGARSLPAKKSGVSTKVIDLTAPNTATETEDESVHQARMKNDTNDESNDIEVVELPAQE